ncbi:hypothetical protein HK100_001383 [Physocladia obscura]|uniref:EF-hand domain-containing protein n=1 Tax=Physocladia obscura TaxID=109957 RepID=A0AAD5XHK4_9FUNG|nr:hypothetical protein HK100_001383 [Physocladia obscura]
MRVTESFAMLEEIIPSLGVFAPIVALLKEELYRSVYSRNLTSCDLEPFVERVPFFCAAGRVDEARQEEAEKANDSLAELQQRIRFRDHDLQILYKKNMALKQDISDYQLNKQNLLEKIRSLEDQCHKYELEKGEATYYYTAKEDSLKLFKTAYNDAPDSMLEEIEKSKMDLVVDSVGMVEYDIYQAERLQEQFAEILNYQMDDFELALSQLRKKKEILTGVAMNESEREASYSLELQFSEDGGDSFKSYKNFDYCGKCGDKTAVCPHKTGSMEPIAVKPHVTHIRIIRPGLKFRTKVKLDDSQKKVVSSFQQDDSEDIEEGEDEQLSISKTIKQCWAEYYDARQGYRPKYTRVFKIDRTLDYIQEIYEARIIYDEKIDEVANRDDTVQYMKFSQRYQIHEVALKGVHDFLTALSKFESENLDVAVFIRHLCSQEVVTWKYIYDVRKLLAKYNDGQTFTPSKYRQVLLVLYPCRPREVYDQMELEFTAYSKNKYTLEIFDEHILHLIDKNIEPNMRFFNLCLKKFDYQETGILQFEDFDEAMTNLMPNIQAKYKRLFYKLAEIGCTRDTVPISILSMICAYLMIHESSLHSWIPQTINAPEVISQISKMIDSPSEKSGSHGGGAGISRGNIERGGPSGASGAQPEERLTQKDVDIILKSDNIHVHGINLDPKAVDEEEARMKMATS